MLNQLNLHLLFSIFSVSPTAMSLISSCQHTTGILCDGALPADYEPHIQYECTTDLSTSVTLPSCANDDSNITVYWFWYDDLCRYSTAHDTSFAIVDSDDTVRCPSRSNISITQYSCKFDYIFTRQTMIIENMTKSSSHKYICLSSRNQATIDYTSAIIYSISISSKFIRFYFTKCIQSDRSICPQTTTD